MNFARPEAAEVLRAIVKCRTAVLGDHVEAGDRRAYRRIAYNSCHNRHLPEVPRAALHAVDGSPRRGLLPVPSRLDEHLSEQTRAATGDPPATVGLSRLILPRYESGVGRDLA